MQGENRPRVPFDDRAALAELERLQHSIQEYRKRREAAEGEFEQFVGSFRKPDVAVSPESSPLPGFFAGAPDESQRSSPSAAAPAKLPPAAALAHRFQAAGGHVCWCRASAPSGSGCSRRGASRGHAVTGRGSRPGAWPGCHHAAGSRG